MQPLTAWAREAAVHGRFERASHERGAVFLCTLLSAAPEHRSRTTEYTKTGLEQAAVSEIHMLVFCSPIPVLSNGTGFVLLRGGRGY